MQKTICKFVEYQRNILDLHRIRSFKFEKLKQKIKFYSASEKKYAIDTI